MEDIIGLLESHDSDQVQSAVCGHIYFGKDSAFEGLLKYYNELKHC